MVRVDTIQHVRNMHFGNLIIMVFLRLFFYTIVRILKCNQLFDGGFDYPVINRLKKNQNIKYNKIKIVYWYVPLKNGKFLVVKNREWKK